MLNSGANMNLQYLKLIALGCLAVVFAVATLLLATGTLRTVDISGNSMEPMLTSDDFVLVKASSSYKEGDVVLYYNPELQHHLLHRITKIENGRYTFQGDNNSSIDSYRASESD